MKSLETRVNHVRVYSKKVEKELNEIRGGGLITPILKEYQEMVELIELLYKKHEDAQKLNGIEGLRKKVLGLKRPIRKGGFLRKSKVDEERDVFNESVENLANSL